MNGSLLLLFIVVPLAASAITTFVRTRWINLCFLLGVPLATVVAGLYLIGATANGHTIAHSVGGYVHGLAIPFVADTFTAVMLVITSLAVVASCAFLRTTGEDQYRFVPTLILLMLTGVNGAILTGDLFNFFVFIEVMVLPSYALIAVTGTWRRLGVGRMFVIVNLLTSTLLVIGVGFIYASTGTVNIAVLADQTRFGDVSPQAALAVGIVVLALLIKAGAAPVHGWLVRSYPNTSAGMMSLFASTHSKVAIYGIYRVYVSVFGGHPRWEDVLLIIVVLTIAVGAFSGFGEIRVRNIFAFQMTAGVGHILIGVAVLTTAAVSAGIFYMVHHIVTMSGLLLTIGAIEQTYGTGAFKKLSGLIRRERVASVLMIIGLFSLIGLPPTSGLWGKMGLVRALMENVIPATIVMVITVVLASIGSLLALQRLWKNTFWGDDMTQYHPDSPATGRAPATDLSDDVRVRWTLLVPGAFMIAISVAMFVGGQAIMPIIQEAANALLHVDPYVEAVLGQ